MMLGWNWFDYVFCEKMKNVIIARSSHIIMFFINIVEKFDESIKIVICGVCWIGSPLLYLFEGAFDDLLIISYYACLRRVWLKWVRPKCFYFGVGLWEGRRPEVYVIFG